MSNDEPPYFAHSATLRIASQQLDFEEVTRAMGMPPTELIRRGEGPAGRPRPYDMWWFSPDVAEERPLSEHIDALWSAIRDREAYLRELKAHAKVDVFLGYRSNSDTAGFELPHTSLEMFVRLEIPVSVSVIIA